MRAVALGRAAALGPEPGVRAAAPRRPAGRRSSIPRPGSTSLMPALGLLHALRLRPRPAVRCRVPRAARGAGGCERGSGARRRVRVDAVRPLPLARRSLAPLRERRLDPGRLPRRRAAVATRRARDVRAPRRRDRAAGARRVGRRLRDDARRARGVGRRSSTSAPGGGGKPGPCCPAALLPSRWPRRSPPGSGSPRSRSLPLVPPGAPEAVRTYWSVHPMALLETLFAGVPGRLAALPVLAHGALREPRALPGLALPRPAAAGLARGGLRRALVSGDGDASPSPASGSLAVAVALGRHAPLYDLVSTLVPPLRVLRYPVKVMIVAAFAWAGLVACGAAAWRRTAPAGGGGSRSSFPWPRSRSSPRPARSRSGRSGRRGRSWPEPGLRRQPGSPWRAGSRGRRSSDAGCCPRCVARVHRSRLLALAATAAAVADLGLAHSRPNPVAPRALYAHRPEVLAALATRRRPASTRTTTPRPGGPRGGSAERPRTGWSAHPTGGGRTPPKRSGCR